MTHAFVLAACVAAFCFVYAVAPMAARAEQGMRDIHWESGPEHPTLRKGGAQDALHGMVISAGGIEHPWEESKRVFAYRPGDERWQPLPDMPLGRAYFNGITAGDAFYAIGGRNTGATQSEVFRLRKDAGDSWRWDAMPPLAQDRAFEALAVVNQKIYAIGGLRFAAGQHPWRPENGTSAVEVFDTKRPEEGWRLLPSLPGPARAASAAAGVDGRVFVFGGCIFSPDEHTGAVRLADAHVYDPSADRWEALPKMPFGLSGAAAVAWRDRFIVIIGGAAEIDDVYRQRFPMPLADEYNRVIIVFDTRNSTYSLLPTSLPRATNDIRLALIDDRIYAVGGENVDPNTSNTTRHLRIGTIVPGDTRDE